jgi:predicted HTH transcriptional regulator
MYDVSLKDLDEPPYNKTRKIIFKDNCKLTLTEKLSIVGKMIGKTKRVTESDIYDAMLYTHDLNQKITIKKLAEYFDCTSRTIHRNMSNELKKEKELLNQSL